MKLYVFNEDHEFGTKMIIVHVDKHSLTRDFAVYEKLIRKSSEFMENALKGPWQESTERVVCLPDFRGEIFEIYHLWLLTGKVNNKKELRNNLTVSPNMSRRVRLRDELLVLKHLTRLGHYILVTSFTDAVSDAILQCCQDLNAIGSWFPKTYGSIFYGGIPEGSPTRTLIVDAVAWTMESYNINSIKSRIQGNFREDYLVDLVVAMARRVLSSSSTTSPLAEPEGSCKYHSHGDEKPCYRKRVAEGNRPNKKRAASDDGAAPAAKRRA